MTGTYQNLKYKDIEHLIKTSYKDKYNVNDKPIYKNICNKIYEIENEKYISSQNNN